MRSNPTALATLMPRSRLVLISEPLPRLARERMNRLLLDNEFILMRSPRRAPPVRFRVGSTQSKHTFLSGLSRSILSINSSSRLLFPAPPVPVNPMTGTSALLVLQVSNTEENTSSEALSERVSNNPTLAISSAETGPLRVAILCSVVRSTSEAFSIRSWIIPINPILRPSSGE